MLLFKLRLVGFQLTWLIFDFNLHSLHWSKGAASNILLDLFYIFNTWNLAIF